MSTQNNAEIEAMLIALKACIDQLNKALEDHIPEEINKVKAQYEEVIHLAGELDAYFTK